MAKLRRIFGFKSPLYPLSYFFSKPLKNPISEHRKIISRSESPQKLETSFATEIHNSECDLEKLFNHRKYFSCTDK